NDLLDKYSLRPLETSNAHEVVNVQTPRPGIQLSGGVVVGALVWRLKAGDATAFKKLLLAARPSGGELSWSVVVATSGGRPEGVKLAVTADATDVAGHLSRAQFLQQKRDYAAAIEAYGKMLARASDVVVGAYLNRGQAYAKTGRYDLAIADYDREISLNP